VGAVFWRGVPTGDLADCCLTFRHYAGTESVGAAGFCFVSIRIGMQETATNMLTIINRK
jgi:hypothetical protein